MLGLINAIVALGGAIERYVREGLVMANKFTPAKLTFPANGSAEFDGASDYITIPNLSIQSSATWTIGAWVYQDFTSGDADYLFDAREDTADGYGFYTTSGTGWVYYDGNGGKVTSNFSAPNEEWYYISIVRDGSSNVKIYKNGSLTDTLTGAETSYNVTGDFRIGVRYNLVQPFEGNMANFAAWNRALSSDEINSVMWKSYEQLTTSESNGLQAWYKLEESELLTDSAADLLEYANNLGLEFEGQTCVQNALTAFPTADAGRLLFEPYDARVVADGGATEARTCTINELNAIL